MAPKGKKGHASSSREKIEDDEDENMSPTPSERNYEPRKDDFTAHEKGTQSNSQFTHPQMGLSQSMLEQSEPEGAKKWLRAELPENVDGMRSAVHAHFLFLLKVRDKDFSSLPAPPSKEELEIALQVAGHLGYVPKDVFNEPSTHVQSQGFQS
ncbi:hypothetical protein O181_101674, partial [Austropuccinia psidii MF-1]|nr:hypothetical protein [Austropuccinia psidii MF-1]